MSGRRDRSRSPHKVDIAGRRRDSKSSSNSDNISMMNQMMMSNMYTQGNMMMGGMFPNMMMTGAMMGGNMMPAGMEMLSTGTAMEMMPQQSIDLTQMAGQPAAVLTPASSSSMEMGMMGGMMMDPSMIGMYQSMGSELSAPPEKKEIILKYCKLSPPEAGTPQPPKRARPPGCRTIFVGGLPDKIRESTVRDIFEPYGRIQTLRLSKKNFCHIRYDREACVDAAMLISGYRIKLIDSKRKDKGEEDDEESHANCGWLHVDYALSRDDQNEYERRQRQALRVQQAQLQQLNAQQDVTAHNMKPYRQTPSPVRVTPFSNAAILQTAEKIKSEENFAMTLPTLISWLERGECSKKNSNQFYSMLQATNSHIRRLFNEKMQAEEELNDTKERVKKHIEKVIEQLEQVGKVFTAATHQRVWDHFTKPQRKNIETWQKMTQEFSTLKEEFYEKFYGNDDNEYNGYNSNTPMDLGNSGEEVQQLKRENESLQFQLEAYKNEVDVIKAEAKKEMEKFKAQFIARQALQGAMETKNPPLPSPLVKPPPPPPLPDDADVLPGATDLQDPACDDAKLIGVMSAFLQVHPQGASLEYIVSYVRAVFPGAARAHVSRVLRAHPTVFARAATGVGAALEHRWSFIALRDLAAA